MRILIWLSSEVLRNGDDERGREQERVENQNGDAWEEGRINFECVNILTNLSFLL